MFTDPAAAAWEAAGRPGVDAPPPKPGTCARCGANALTVTSSRIISERFAGFDAWPYGSRRLCVPCAWAYTHPPTTAPTMLITTTTTTIYPDAAALGPLLSMGALQADTAAVVPVARRRHILPTAQWGQLATDALVVRWDAAAATCLSELRWLRSLDTTWPQLSRHAPPLKLLTSQPAALWNRVLAAWAMLQPWRRVPPLWSAAGTLSLPARDTAAEHHRP